MAAFAAHYPEFPAFWREQGGSPDALAELSWQAACDRDQLDAVATLGAFAQVVSAVQIPDERDWTAVTLDELVDNLVTYHHLFVRTQLGRMSAMLHLLAVSAPQPSQRIDHARSALAFLTQRWLSHMEMEERDFFPACLRLETSRDFLSRHELDELVGALHHISHDHREIDLYAERLEQALESVADDIDPRHFSVLSALRSCLEAFIQDARIHAAKEDDILMPAVMFAHDLRRSDSESGRFSSH